MKKYRGRVKKPKTKRNIAAFSLLAEALTPGALSRIMPKPKEKKMRSDEAIDFLVKKAQNKRVKREKKLQSIGLPLVDKA